MEYIVDKGDKKIIVHAECTNSCYTLCPIINGQEAGNAKFSIDKEEKRTELDEIVRYTPFKGQGVASAMLDVMEYISSKEKVRCIDGWFAPSENESDVERFYKRNGYKILQHPYDKENIKIFKALTKEIKNVEEITHTEERTR